MSKRIGELLIARGLLTQRQLDAALRSQLIVGGHLGTSLIELGFVKEDELGRLLAETFDVRQASAEMFDQLPHRVLSLVTRELAARHMVVPLDASTKALDVAMVSPNDFIALQELSFATGRRIVPLVCPEARIIQALERYYGVERPRRFVTLTERLVESARPDRRVVSADPFYSGGAGAPPVLADGGPESAAGMPAVATAVAEEHEAAAAVAAVAAVALGARAETTEPRTDLEPLGEMLCGVDTDSEIVNAIGAFLGRTGERLALFAVESERARCWGVSGDGFDAARLPGMTFALEEFTLFHLLTEEPYFCGPVPADSESERFFQRLGIEAPVEIALFPIYRQGRVESILYADSGASTGLAHDPATYGSLSKKATLARYLVDVKARIRRR